MNQILLSTISKSKHKLRYFKFQLFISLITITLVTLYWLFFYKYASKQNLSSTLINNFHIEHIYSNNQNYTAIKLNNNTYTYVIGIIEIEKINITYPILSEVSDDLLKISACRFYGPLPNRPGNLCIAAHNYDDNRFFGNLNKLNISDTINIYDLNNTLITYYIYDKFETLKSDTSCTNQNTNNKKEITLVTCNNLNNKRLIIKAKEQ